MGDQSSTQYQERCNKARELARAFDEEQEAKRRLSDAERANREAHERRLSLQFEVCKWLTDAEPRMLFTFDGKTALTIERHGPNTTTVRYDQRIYRS